jgi:hypothetical protein
MEKELLAMVFTNKKFGSYLVGAKVIMYIDHTALKYHLTRKDAKPHPIRWILLLQEFDLENRDRKGVENSVTDHLSHLQFEESAELPINDYTRDDTLLEVSTIDPWYANILNYIVVGYIPPGADRKIIRDSKVHLWDDPYMYRVCTDGLLRIHGRFLSIVMQHHMVATMELSTPMQRCGKADSIGLPWMKMTSLLFGDAQDAEAQEY